MDTTTEHRLTEIETLLREIKGNELVHLKEEVRAIRNWVFGIFASIIVGLLGLLVERLCQ